MQNTNQGKLEETMINTRTFDAALVANTAAVSLKSRLVAWFIASPKPVKGTWADGAFGL